MLKGCLISGPNMSKLFVQITMTGADINTTFCTHSTRYTKFNMFKSQQTTRLPRCVSFDHLLVLYGKETNYAVSYTHLINNV